MWTAVDARAIPSTAAVVEARAPAPSAVLRGLATGLLGRSVAGAGQSFWDWPRARFAEEAAVAVKTMLVGVDLPGLLRMSVPEMDVVKRNVAFLAAACDAPSEEHVFQLVAAMSRLENGGMNLVLCEFETVKDVPFVRQLQDLVLPFLRVLALLKYTNALSSARQSRLPTIKDWCRFGHGGEFMRSVIVEYDRLCDPVLNEYFTRARGDYFTRYPLTSVLSWLETHPDLLELDTWEFATERDVGFYTLKEFCRQYANVVSFSDELKTKFGGAGHTQLLAFKYVYALHPTLHDIDAALVQCREFTEPAQFMVNAHVKRAAAASAAAAAPAPANKKEPTRSTEELHAASLRRRTTASCTGCVALHECVTMGCTMTPADKEFRCTFGYHLCSQHSNQWTQKPSVTGDSTWLTLKNKDMLRCVHLRNTMISFTLAGQGEQTRYYVDARRTRVVHNLDPNLAQGRGGEEANRQPPAEDRLVSSMCKMYLTYRHESGQLEAQLRVGAHISAGVYAVDFASVRYLFRCEETAGQSVKAADHLRVTLLDGREVTLSLTAAENIQPSVFNAFVQPPLTQPVSVTSLRVRRLFPAHLAGSPQRPQHTTLTLSFGTMQNEQDVLVRRVRTYASTGTELSCVDTTTPFLAFQDAVDAYVSAPHTGVPSTSGDRLAPVKRARRAPAAPAAAAAAAAPAAPAERSKRARTNKHN